MGIESPKTQTKRCDMEFHEHLKQLRETKELTQLQAAEALGIAKNTYIGYEKGEREPRLSELKKMAGLFEMNLSDLCMEARSGLSGWLKGSFEAAQTLKAKDKAALIRVIDGYVAARRVIELSGAGRPAEEQYEDELFERIVNEEESEEYYERMSGN